MATVLVATVGNGEQYSKGLQMAAALGLTPRQNSSGDKHRLFGISKRGDVYLRTQMIHGARAVVSQAKHRHDPLSRWVTDIAKRRHPNVAAVALANKTAVPAALFAVSFFEFTWCDETTPPDAQWSKTRITFRLED